jgi:hypothetical protein
LSRSRLHTPEPLVERRGSGKDHSINRTAETTGLARDLEMLMELCTCELNM